MDKKEERRLKIESWKNKEREKAGSETEGRGQSVRELKRQTKGRSFTSTWVRSTDFDMLYRHLMVSKRQGTCRVLRVT